MKRHPVLAYLALTFAISWGGIFVVAGPDGIPLPMTADPLQASPLLYVAMLAGPAIAGIAMTGVVHGRAGFRGLLPRLLAWRVGPRWYGVALLTAPLLSAVIAILLAASFRSSDLLPAILTAENRTTLFLSTIALSLIVGLFEELGWTGFAAPALRRSHGVLVTGLMLGVVWGVWHFLLFWEGDSFANVFPFMLLLVKLFSFLVPYRVLMVWAHDRTGSLFIAILMHAGLIAGLQPAVVEPIHIVASDLLFAAALWAIVGALALRGQFSQPRPWRPVPQPVAAPGRVS